MRYFPSDNNYIKNYCFIIITFIIEFSPWVLLIEMKIFFFCYRFAIHSAHLHVSYNICINCCRFCWYMYWRRRNQNLNNELNLFIWSKMKQKIVRFLKTWKRLLLEFAQTKNESFCYVCFWFFSLCASTYVQQEFSKAITL